MLSIGRKICAGWTELCLFLPRKATIGADGVGRKVGVVLSNQTIRPISTSNKEEEILLPKNLCIQNIRGEKLPTFILIILMLVLLETLMSLPLILAPRSAVRATLRMKFSEDMSKNQGLGHQLLLPALPKISISTIFSKNTTRTRRFGSKIQM